MPIYNYKCTDCSNSFEQIIISSEDLKSVVCPKCRSKKISKVFSTFSVGKSSKTVDIPPSCSTCPGRGGSCGF